VIHYRIFYTPAAESDLSELISFLAVRGGAQRAFGYVSRIKTFCDSLEYFPKRGIARDDLEPGLRLIGFENRVTIAFSIELEKILIIRILYGGRNIDTILGTVS
jgi:toxin ParE1/3/4